MNFLLHPHNQSFVIAVIFDSKDHLAKLEWGAFHGDNGVRSFNQVTITFSGWMQIKTFDKLEDANNLEYPTMVRSSRRFLSISSLQVRDATNHQQEWDAVGLPGFQNRWIINKISQRTLFSILFASVRECCVFQVAHQPPRSTQHHLIFQEVDTIEAWRLLTDWLSHYARQWRLWVIERGWERNGIAWNLLASAELWLDGASGCKWLNRPRISTWIY